MYRKMNKDQEQPDFSGKFHTVQPLRDLESNWAVDLAKNLEEYLLKICTGEITGEDDGYLSVNFAEAALLLQGSIQVYSRKVEYLYTLVLHALEFISKKSQQDQPKSTPDQAEESGWHAVADEENDPFWGLDDIPVEAKNSLDSVTSRDDPLNHFVKAPANLVVLEGDCLDATGDGGELESYLLATNDLYRDFILLDPCDAVAVNDFIKGDYKASKWQNSVRGVSSLNSKYRKSFQSPAKHSGGTDQRLSVGKNKDAKLNQSPLVDHCFLFNDCNTGSYPAADIPEDNNPGFEMDNGYSEPRDSDDDDDDDPWKPLNPHEPGNLKVKPYKKVKAVRREGVNSSQQIPLTTEFPLARLHGPISSELSEMWEKKRRALEKQQELQSPPLYEKLRQSLVHGEQENCATFWNFKDDNADNDTGTPDFDMPEGTHIDEEEPLHPEKHNDGDVHFDANEDYGLEDPHANLEDLCRSHLDSLLASIAETEKQTEVAARVSTWKQRIEQSLEEQDSRPPFDIHEYGGRVLDRLSLGADSGNAMSFADVVCGQEKHDIARTFSALLQLVNNGNVDLERAGSDSESKCYTAANPFYVRLLMHDKRREEVLVQLSKKRAKSPMRKGYTEGERNKSGKENCPVVRSSPSGSTSPEISSQLNCNFSVKLGKLGGARHTPEGKRRRRSRFVEPVDLHSTR